MSAPDTAELSRWIRKNWLTLLSIILLITSAFFIISVESRKPKDAENVERIKRMQEYSEKSLSQLAKLLGMSEQEMIVAYNQGRLCGPVVDIIRKKLTERNKIKRELLGTSTEKLEEEKENLADGKSPEINGNDANATR